MAEKTLTENLNALFNDLLEKANGDKIDVSTKLEIFKEGVRWAAVSNKIAPDEDEKDGKTKPNRLAGFKRGLKR